MDRLSCFYSFFLSLHHKSKALVHFVGSGSGEPGTASGMLISLPGMNTGATTVHRSSITPLLSFSHVMSLMCEFSLFLFPANVSRIFTLHESVLIFFFSLLLFLFPPTLNIQWKEVGIGFLLNISQTDQKSKSPRTKHESFSYYMQIHRYSKERTSLKKYPPLWWIWH